MRPVHEPTLPRATEKPAWEPTDAELLQQIARGDLAPLGVLYDRYQQDVHAFIKHARQGAPDSEDIAHETFLQLVHIAGRFDGRSSARPLLLGIAAQLVRRRRRTWIRWARMCRRLTSSLQGTFDLTPEIASADREELRRFERALAHLSDDKRMTFLLIELGGMSGEEVASALSVPVNTVWTRLHHARCELRRVFSREGSS